MGRNDLLDADEVAEILNCSRVWVNQLTRDGIIRSHRPFGESVRSKSPRLYRPDEIEAYKKCRDARVDLASVYNMAMQAEVRSRAAERRLEQLEFLAGLNVPVPPQEPTEVRTLLKKIEEKTLKPPTKAGEILEWGNIFLGIHQEFFQLVELYAEHPKPWDPFFRLGEAIRRNAPRGGEPEELQLRQAHGYFNTAYRALCNEAFFYVDGRHGRRAANREVPEADVHERILRHVAL